MLWVLRRKSLRDISISFQLPNRSCLKEAGCVILGRFEGKVWRLKFLHCFWDFVYLILLSEKGCVGMYDKLFFSTTIFFFFVEDVSFEVMMYMELCFWYYVRV